MKPLVPMKAHLGSLKDLSLKNVLFEPKLDGIRALCYVNKYLRLFSRNGINITDDYPEFDFRKAIQAKSAILDGEIIVLDEEGKPSFSLWQQGYRAHFVVFDILMLNGKSLRELSLLRRKEILDKVVRNTEGIEKILYTTQGETLWNEIIKRGMEGIVAKKTNSLYLPGVRTKSWIKIKRTKALEAVIIGYSKKKRALASLALGLYDDQGNLHYIGSVGTGFSERFIRKILPELNKRVLEEKNKIVWVKPELVGEVKYAEWTPQGHLRQPVFLRLRPDRDPREMSFVDQEVIHVA